MVIKKTIRFDDIEYVCTDIAFYNHIRFIQNITRVGGGKVLKFKNFDIFINTKTSIATYIFLKSINIALSDLSQMIDVAKEQDVQFAIPLEYNDLFYGLINLLKNDNRFFIGSIAKDSYLQTKHFRNTNVFKFPNEEKLELFDISVSEQLFDEYNKISSDIFSHNLTEIPLMLKGVRNGVDENTEMFIVKRGANTVGMCGFFSNKEKGIATLYADGIKKEFRRIGLGRAMVIKRVNMLIEKGYHTVTVNNMPDSVAIYRRLGFKYIGDLVFFISKI